MVSENSETNDDIQTGVDLFGEPLRPIKDRRGRKSFAKTKENQDTVMALRAVGWSQARIARYMGCDVKTLTKHFSLELEAGADFVEGQCVEVLYKRMREGHRISAVDLIKMTKQGHAMPPPKPERPAEKLGKKEQQQRDAETGHDGTEWAGLLREPGQTLN